MYQKLFSWKNGYVENTHKTWCQWPRAQHTWPYVQVSVSEQNRFMKAKVFVWIQNKTKKKKQTNKKSQSIFSNDFVFLCAFLQKTLFPAKALAHRKATGFFNQESFQSSESWFIMRYTTGTFFTMRFFFFFFFVMSSLPGPRPRGLHCVFVNCWISDWFPSVSSLIFNYLVHKVSNQNAADDNDGNDDGQGDGRTGFGFLTTCHVCCDVKQTLPGKLLWLPASEIHNESRFVIWNKPACYLKNNNIWAARNFVFVVAGISMHDSTANVRGRGWGQTYIS